MDASSPNILFTWLPQTTTISNNFYPLAAEERIQVTESPLQFLTTLVTMLRKFPVLIQTTSNVFRNVLGYIRLEAGATPNPLATEPIPTILAAGATPKNQMNGRCQTFRR